MTKHTTPYAALIATYTDANPAWVEAWMRLEHRTLDGLSPAQFRAEVATAEACIAASTATENDDLARSYGLA